MQLITGQDKQTYQCFLEKIQCFHASFTSGRRSCAFLLKKKTIFFFVTKPSSCRTACSCLWAILELLIYRSSLILQRRHRFVCSFLLLLSASWDIHPWFFFQPITVNRMRPLGFAGLANGDWAIIFFIPSICLFSTFLKYLYSDSRSFTISFIRLVLEVLVNSFQHPGIARLILYFVVTGCKQSNERWCQIR